MDQVLELGNDTMVRVEVSYIWQLKFDVEASQQ